MNVLLLKRNVEIVADATGTTTEKLYEKTVRETTNTVTLSITTRQFRKVEDWCKDNGINIYALLAW